MGSWKSRLSKFITGESTILSGDNFDVVNKTNAVSGSYQWMTGQTGVSPYAYIINVQVNVPSGYTKEKSATEAGTLIYDNMLKTNKKITFVSFWNYNLLFGAQSLSDAQSFATELKNLSGNDPEKESIDWGLVFVGIAALSAVIYILKRK